MFETEYQFVLELCRFLKTLGFKTLTEVPDMGQSIDILAYKGEEFTAIEVKLHGGWRRGLQQCHGHRLVADYICFAIASANISQDLILEAEKRGYGLFHYDRDLSKCYEALAPQRNENVYPAQVEQFKRIIMEVDNWHLAPINDIPDFQYTPRQNLSP